MTVVADRRIRNDTLRSVRLSLRMSQSEFASAVRRAGDALGEPNTANKRLVQKWESGEHGVCRPNYRRALQAVTRLPYARLGFAGAESASVAAAPDATVAGMGTAGAVQGVECSDRLRFALDKPAATDAGIVAFAELTTAHLFDREHHEPARDLAPAVERHVAEVATLLTGARIEHLRRRLACTGGRCGALAGWLAFDTGRVREAVGHWENALAAARYAGDGPLAAYVFTLMSYAAEQRGDPAAGWQLARSAVMRAGGDVRAAVWMSVRAAQQAALLGEKREAHEDLRRAFDLGTQLPDVREDTAPWLRFFDRCTLGAMAVGVHVTLGEYAAARSAAESTARLVGSTRVKTRALALAEIARAAAGAGELDEMLDYGLRAADLAEQLEVTLARNSLRALVPVLKRHPSRAAARTLLARINTIPQ